MQLRSVASVLSLAISVVVSRIAAIEYVDDPTWGYDCYALNPSYKLCPKQWLNNYTNCDIDYNWYQSPIPLDSRTTINITLNQRTFLPSTKSGCSQYRVSQLPDRFAAEPVRDDCGFYFNTTVYTLIEVRTRLGAEHPLNNKIYGAEIQFVHQLKSVGEVTDGIETSPFAVISFLIRASSPSEEVSAPPQYLVDLFNAIANAKRQFSSIVDFADFGTFIDGIFAQQRMYYEYKGSSTIPGCDPGYTYWISPWIIPLNDNMLDILKGAHQKLIKSAYGVNRRPIQNGFARDVSLYTLQETK